MKLMKKFMWNILNYYNFVQYSEFINLSFTIWFFNGNRLLCFWFLLLLFFYFNNFFYGKGSQITDKYVNNIFSYETGGHFNSEKPINGFILEKKLYESIAISFTVVSIVTWSIVRLSNLKSIFHKVY